jgi:protein O-mannosyl-transferase
VRRAALAALAVAALALVLYLPTVRYDFVRYDDPNYVQLHPRVAEGLSWDNVRWAFGAFEVGNWHPLTLISHMTDVSLFGMRPGAHHLVNAALHAINAALLLILFTRATGRLVPATAAATLFAIHPLNVESVAWISQRKSVLAMAFLLLAMSAYVGWVRHGRARSYVASVAFVAAALAAKPMALVAPLLLLALDVWPLRREVGTLRLLVEKLPFLALAGAASVVTIAAQSAGGAIGSLEAVPAVARVTRAVFAYAWYLLRMVWPANLSLFYPTTLDPSAVARVAGAALLLAAVLVLTLRYARRLPYVAFAAIWYAAALLPVAGLVQYGTQIVADRYAYLALVGPFVALSYGVADAVDRLAPAARLRAQAASGACLLALVVAQQLTLPSWRDSDALFARGLARAPDNPHVLTNLGLLRVNEGRLDEGIELLSRAEKLVPLFRPLQVNLGYAYAQRGDLERARRHYEEALAIRGDDAAIVLELGRVLSQMGDLPGAEARMREAVSLDPGRARAHLFLGTLLHVQGRAQEARPILERAVSLDPADAPARLALGLVLEACGEPAGAAAALREAVRLDPKLTRARVELERITAGSRP